MHAMKLFFYFNGFNSAILDDYSGSRKIVAAADYARRRAYRFVPVSINYRQALKHRREILEQIGESTGEVIFCGSSMGGWFARIMQLWLDRSQPGLSSVAVAFNPAFDLWLHRQALSGPQVNHVTLEEYVWTEDHSRQLKVLEDAVDYDAALPFYVYADKGDEVIPWKESAARHIGISRFLAFDGGCHSFDHFLEALEDFDSAHFP